MIYKLNNSTILGLDVGKASAVGFALESVPNDIGALWKSLKAQDFYYLKCDVTGIDQLIAIAPDAIALEPTGTHYSEFWRSAAIKLGIRVLWVGHLEVRHFRLSNRLPSKNDRADSLALACYGKQHEHQQSRFIQFDAATAKLRSLVWQLNHLHHLKTPIINRIRQQLSHEFPEAAYRQTQTALWRWLALKDVPYYDRLYTQSVTRYLDTEISSFTRGLAQQLMGLMDLEADAENELSLFLDSPNFAPYREVFARFGFGERLEAQILVSAYPLSKFRQEIDGKQVWNGKAFKLKLGMGLIEKSSGDTRSFVPGGSSLCRKYLYLWVVTRIASPVARPDGDLAQDAIAYYEKLKIEMSSKRLAKLRICKVAARSARILFGELKSKV